MTVYLAHIEQKLSNYLRKDEDLKEDNWMEQGWKQAEKISGMTRERITIILIILSVISMALGSLIPMLSHIICTAIPIWKTLKILRKKNPVSDDILFYWIFYTLVSLLDYSHLATLPFYFFGKAALFGYLLLNDQICTIRDYSEPILQFIDEWFLTPPPNQLKKE